MIGLNIIILGRKPTTTQTFGPRSFGLKVFNFNDPIKLLFNLRTLSELCLISP